MRHSWSERATVGEELDKVHTQICAGCNLKKIQSKREVDENIEHSTEYHWPNGDITSKAGECGGGMVDADN